MWDPLAEVQSVVLPNGLTIYCSHWPGRAFELIEFIVHSGSDQDPEGKEGLAHFVEHVVTENGTESMANMQQFFERHGDRVHFGSTGPLATKYGFCLPADCSILSEALRYFSGYLFGAKLENEIEKQRSIILGEFRRKFPTKKSWNHFWENQALLARDGRLWKGGNTLGTEETIQGISQRDLQGFYESHYTPPNMSIVCSGGVSFAELLELFRVTGFAKSIPGTRTPRFPIVTDVGDYSSHRKEVQISKKNKEVERNVCRFETRTLIPGVYSKPVVNQFCDLLHQCLYLKLREELHLIYDISIEMQTIRGSYAQVTIVCDGIKEEVIDRVEAEVTHAIATLPEQKDLYEKQCRTSRSGRIYFDPTVEGTAQGMIREIITFHRITTRQEYFDACDAVTFQDVLNILPFFALEKRWIKITRP